MRIGPFLLSGAWDDRTVDHARQLLAVDGPWWVLPAHHRGRIRLNIIDDDRPWAGIYIHADGSIHLPPSHTMSTLAHEVGHAIDAIILGHAGRRAVLAAWGREPDLMLWGGGGLPHNQRPSEAFANWFAWWCGWRAQPYYGPHRWDTPAVADRIGEIVMSAADRTVPFDDADLIAEVHRDAVLWAAGLGLLQGDADGNVHPGEPVSRQQMASLLYRYHQTQTV